MADDTHDSLLREIAAAPSIELPADVATLALLEPGAVIDDKFVIEARLGAGGMGVVYAARDLVLDREVAIKLMRLDRGRHDRHDKLPEVFEREARATARLNHPNIVTLHEFGNWNGVLYLVLERLRGETLGARLERGPIPLVEALAILERVASSLVHTHGSGIIHRDLKPQNVFLVEDGGVKVLDFGVSGLGLAAITAPRPSLDRHGSTTSFAGTPGYMAPEQWEGLAQDARTDLWAVGVMLYQLVAGTLPFGTTKPAAAVDVVPVRAQLPPSAGELISLVERLLELRRDAREHDASRVAKTLQAIRMRLDPVYARAVQPRSLAARAARRMAGVTGALVIGIGVAANAPGSAASRCDGGRELVGVWDDTIRGQLAASFQAAGPTSTTTWPLVETTLDRYTREWIALRERACRHGDARMSRCLDDRRERIARFVAAHASVDATRMTWALSTAQSLPAVSDCADPDYLARWIAGGHDTARSTTGLVRSALLVSGAGRDVIHGAVATGDETGRPQSKSDFIVTGVVSSDDGAFASGRIERAGGFVARVRGDDTLAWVQSQTSGKVLAIAKAQGPRTPNEMIARANVIVVGGHYQQATSLGGLSLPAPNGPEDCFAGALDADTGRARWLLACGASDAAGARSVAADRDGNAYLAGDFGGRATFGGTALLDAAARPSKVPFVASWSPTGQLRWVTPGRGIGASLSKGLAITGDLVVLGAQVTGVGRIGERELVAGGCVVAALDRESGTARWIRELAIPGCELHGVAAMIDAPPSASPSSTSIDGARSADANPRIAVYGRSRRRGAFVVELAARDGTDRWESRFGSYDSESVRGGTYLRDGTLVVVGRFGGPTFAIGDHSLASAGELDAFLAAFDPAGRIVGALSIGGPKDEHLRWIGRGVSDTVLVSGRFAGGFVVGTRRLRASADSDGLLLELALPWTLSPATPSSSALRSR